MTIGQCMIRSQNKVNYKYKNPYYKCVILKRTMSEISVLDKFEIGEKIFHYLNLYCNKICLRGFMYYVYNKKLKEKSKKENDTFFLTLDEYYSFSFCKKTGEKEISLRIYLLYFRLTEYVKQHNKNWKIYASTTCIGNAKLKVYFGNNSTDYVSIIIPTDCLYCYAESLLLLGNKKRNDLTFEEQHYKNDETRYDNFENLVNRLIFYEELNIFLV